MSVTATIYVEHELIALSPTLRSLQSVDIEVISQGTTAPGETSFPFRIDYDDREELETALEEDPTVAVYELVDWAGGSGIYSIEHTPETKLVSTVVTSVNGYLAHTETKGTGWLVRLLLPDRSGLNTIWEYAAEERIDLELIEVYGNHDAGGESSYGLTDQQKAALRVAFSEGYFDEPRGASLEEIATEMDLSSTAISGRLRRGMRNLVAATIGDELTDE
ncbi:MAG: helix-turn-helix domain-containing protein [Haloarculaceae archaeon]